MRSLFPKNVILLRKAGFIRHTNPWTDTQIHTLLTLDSIAMGGAACLLHEVVTHSSSCTFRWE